jgi:hypothetical protein
LLKTSEQYDADGMLLNPIDIVFGKVPQAFCHGGHGLCNELLGNGNGNAPEERP